MAYEPTTWQCGDVITAEKLNKLEGGVESAQNGYECTEAWEPLFEETVTTASETPEDELAFGSLMYSVPITAEVLIVTFDGVEYTCPKQEVLGSGCAYGADVSDPTDLDFSEFPFLIMSSPNGQNEVATETAGEYTIAVDAKTLQATVGPCFSSAVKSMISEYLESHCAGDSFSSVSNSEVNLKLSGNVTVPRHGSMVALTTTTPVTVKDFVCLQGIKNIPNGLTVGSIYFTSASNLGRYNLNLHNVTDADITVTAETISVDAVIFTITSQSIQYVECGDGR